MTQIICIIGFFCGFFVYRTGIKDGQKIAQGGKIKNILHKKQKTSEEEERIKKGMENILNYANRRKKGESLNG